MSAFRPVINDDEAEVACSCVTLGPTKSCYYQGCRGNMGAGRGLRGYGGTGGEHTALLSHDDGLEGGCVKGPHRWMRVAVYVVLVSIITSATVVVTLVSLDESSGDARKGGDGYRNGAVASDAGVCSDIGVDVLRSGGKNLCACFASMSLGKGGT